jgi:hypothetical protein
MSRKPEDHSTSRADGNNRPKQHFERSLRKTLRSDPVYVVTRILILLIVFSVMARSIVVHDIAAGYLLLPFSIEWLTVLWVGFFLSRLVIDCKGFRQDSGGIKRPLGWTLFIGIIAVISVGWNSELAWFEVDQIIPGSIETWDVVVSSGLIWALVAECFSLVSSTVPEVMKFQPGRGQFVWSYANDIGIRMATLFFIFVAMWFVGIIGIMFLAPSPSDVAEWRAESSIQLSWVVFGFLALLDFGALALGVSLHRKIKRPINAGQT